MNIGLSTDRKEQARKIAWEAVEKDLSEDYSYKTSIEEVDGNWEFTFLPDAPVRGGGVEVKVDKAELKVVDITFIQ